MRFLNTFRGRLLVILAVMLVATLGVQYYLNLVTQEENARLREQQEQAVVAGIALGFTAMTSPENSVEDLINEPGQTFLSESARERIRDIIVINNKWQVHDSLNAEYRPTGGDG